MYIYSKTKIIKKKTTKFKPTTNIIKKKNNYNN